MIPKQQRTKEVSNLSLNFEVKYNISRWYLNVSNKRFSLKSIRREDDHGEWIFKTLCWGSPQYPSGKIKHFYFFVMTRGWVHGASWAGEFSKLPPFLVLFKMRLSQKFFNCLSKVLGSDGELWWHYGEPRSKATTQNNLTTEPLTCPQRRFASVWLSHSTAESPETWHSI